ncbi:MAG: NAD-dependent dihydropyrimidine dehydrogenase subunit PreA [Thermoplasmata archaeon]
MGYFAEGYDYGMDLSVKFCGLMFENPFLLASAPPAGTGEMIQRSFKAGWAGAVTKTLALPKDVPEDVAPRFAAFHTPNERMVGFENIELITTRQTDIWLKEIREIKENWPEKVLIVSTMAAGGSEDDWRELTKLVVDAGADMIECNLGCPHGMPERGMGSICGQDPEIARSIARWTKMEAGKAPVLMKLTPNVTDPVVIAQAVREGGADGVSAINTVLCLMGVDVDTFEPQPSVDGRSSYGGYSGPAVKPIGLRLISQITKMDGEGRIAMPISGIGGITTWKDAVEYMSLGATTVQLCTAVMQYGYSIIDDLCQGLANYMRSKGFDSVHEIVGRALPNVWMHSHLDLGYVVKARIDEDTCIKCGRCVVACDEAAFQAIDWGSGGFPAVQEEKCTGCSLCMHVCPVINCISMKRIRGKEVAVPA